MRLNRGLLSIGIVALAGCADLTSSPDSPQDDVYTASVNAYHAEYAGRPARIHEAIDNQQIVRDMTLDEVRMVLELQPNEGQQIERLWCGKASVQVCADSCARCRGLVISRWGSVIYLRGLGANPLVIDIRHTETDRPELGAFMASDVYLTFEIARAIHAGQIVPGMTLDEVKQTLPGHNLDETYHCAKAEVLPCASACPNCRVEFHLQGNTIILDNKRDAKVLRVTRIVPMLDSASSPPKK